MDKMTVSVVVPIYNGSKYLEEAIDSIMSQPRMVDNIILVDDGSTDESVVICDNLAIKFPNIQVIHQPNAGVSVARNKGILLSDDTYIVFCDADDMWEKNFFDDDVIDILSENYDIVGFQHYNANEIMGDRSLVINQDKNQFIEGGGNQAIWKHQKRHLGCLFFRREFLKLKEIEFPVGLTYNEDEIFKVTAEYLSESMSFYSKPMYIYRVHKNSTVHNLDKSIIDRYETWMQAWKNMDKWLLKKHGKKTDFGKKFAEAYFIEMCEVYLQEFKPIKPLNKIMKEHMKDPMFGVLKDEDYPDYMKKDVLLFKNRRCLFVL